jgi:hypothetical protein
MKDHVVVLQHREQRPDGQELQYAMRRGVASPQAP